MNNEYYSTTDLNLSSAMLVIGHELSHVDKKNAKAIFYFPASHKISRDAELYVMDKLPIKSAYSLVQAIKQLKTIIYS